MPLSPDEEREFREYLAKKRRRESNVRELKDTVRETGMGISIVGIAVLMLLAVPVAIALIIGTIVTLTH
jgi:hypothetical protein